LVIKSFPVCLVKNFRAKQCNPFSYLAHAAFESRAQLCRCGRLPASAERFGTGPRVWKHDLRFAFCCTFANKSQPPPRQERHVAAHDYTPFAIRRTLRRIFKRYNYFAERPFSWSLFLDLLQPNSRLLVWRLL